MKFCTKLSKLLKNKRLVFVLKKIKKKWGKNAKNLLGVFAQVKINLKKNLSLKESRFIK